MNKEKRLVIFLKSYSRLLSAGFKKVIASVVVKKIYLSVLIHIRIGERKRITRF